jgi:PadR family transcriptional regulator, regulatory protein PadR
VKQQWPLLPLTIYKSAATLRGMGKPADLLQGTLDLLILRTLAWQPSHGWAIAQRIEECTSKVLLVQQGSLYPALHRMEEAGWIESTWGESENKRKAKFYALTATGRKRLEEEQRNWDRLSGAVKLVMEQGS